MIVQVDNVSIVSLNPHLTLKEENYAAGSLQSTVETDIEGFDKGIYRVKLSDPNCNHSRVDATVFKETQSGLHYPAGWSNSSVDPAFDAKSTTQFNRNNLLSGFQGAITPLAVSDGHTVRFSITVTIAGGGTGTIIWFLTEATETTAYASQTNSGIATGTTTIDVELTASGGSPTRLRIRTGLSAGSTMDITMVSAVSIEAPASEITETKTIDINCECSNQDIYLMWLNPLGGYDSWKFTAKKDINRSITSTGETSKNIFPTWPISYGEFADTDKRKHTFRDSRREMLVRSQHLTQDQVDMISGIKSSTVVQIVNSIYDRRMVMVDTQSFTERKEANKLHEISFLITYSDDLPSQRAQRE